MNLKTFWIAKHIVYYLKTISMIDIIKKLSQGYYAIVKNSINN
jgi:hypothetical protein